MYSIEFCTFTIIGRENGIIMLEFFQLGDLSSSALEELFSHAHTPESASMLCASAMYLMARADRVPTHFQRFPRFPSALALALSAASVLCH